MGGQVGAQPAVGQPLAPGEGAAAEAPVRPEGYVPPTERSAKDMMSFADLFAMKGPKTEPAAAETVTPEEAMAAAMPNLADLAGRSSQVRQDGGTPQTASNDGDDLGVELERETEAGVRSVTSSGMAGPMRSARTLGDGSMPELGSGMAGAPEPDWSLAKAPADEDDGAPSQQQQQTPGQQGEPDGAEASAARPTVSLGPDGQPLAMPASSGTPAPVGADSDDRMMSGQSVQAAVSQNDAASVDTPAPDGGSVVPDETMASQTGSGVLPGARQAMPVMPAGSMPAGMAPPDAEALTAATPNGTAVDPPTGEAPSIADGQADPPVMLPPALLAGVPQPELPEPPVGQGPSPIATGPAPSGGTPDPDGMTAGGMLPAEEPETGLAPAQGMPLGSSSPMPVMPQRPEMAGGTAAPTDATAGEPAVQAMGQVADQTPVAGDQNQPAIQGGTPTAMPAVPDATGKVQAMPAVPDGTGTVRATLTAYVTPYGEEQVVSFKPMADGRPRRTHAQERSLSVQAMQMIAGIEQAQHQWAAAPPKPGASLFDDLGPLPPRKTSWKERLAQRAEAQANAAAAGGELPEGFPPASDGEDLALPVQVQTLGTPQAPMPRQPGQPEAGQTPSGQTTASQAEPEQPWPGVPLTSRTLKIAQPQQATGRKWSGQVHLLPKPPAKPEPAAVRSAKAAAIPATDVQDAGPTRVSSEAGEAPDVPDTGAPAKSPDAQAGQADAHAVPSAKPTVVGQPAYEAADTQTEATGELTGEVSESVTVPRPVARRPVPTSDKAAETPTEGTNAESPAMMPAAGETVTPPTVEMPAPAATDASAQTAMPAPGVTAAPPAAAVSPPEELDTPAANAGVVAEATADGTPQPPAMGSAPLPPGLDDVSKPKARGSFLGSALTQSLRSTKAATDDSSSPEAVAEPAAPGFALSMPDLTGATPPPPAARTTATPTDDGDPKDPMAKLKSKLGGGSPLGNMMGSSSLMGGFVSGSSPKQGGGSFFNMVSQPTSLPSGVTPLPDAETTGAAEASDTTAESEAESELEIGTTAATAAVSAKAGDGATRRQPTLGGAPEAAAAGEMEPSDESTEAAKQGGLSAAGEMAPSDETAEMAEPDGLAADEEAEGEQATITGRATARTSVPAAGRLGRPDTTDPAGELPDETMAEGEDLAFEADEPLDGMAEPETSDGSVIARRAGSPANRTAALATKIGMPTGDALGASDESAAIEGSPDGDELVDDLLDAVDGEEAPLAAGRYRLPTLLRQKERMEAAVARIPIAWTPSGARPSAGRGDQPLTNRPAGLVPPEMADDMSLPPGVPNMGPPIAVPGVIPDLHAPIRSVLSAQADEMMAAEAMTLMAELAATEAAIAMGDMAMMVEGAEDLLPPEADPGNLTTSGTVVAGEVGATVVRQNRGMPGQQRQNAHVAAILSGTALPTGFVATRAGTPTASPSVPPPVAAMGRQTMVPAGRATAPAEPQPERPRTPVTREMLAAMPATLRPALAAVSLADTGAHGAWDQSRLTDPRPLEQRPVQPQLARKPEADRTVPSTMSYVQLGSGHMPEMPEQSVNGRIVMPQPAPQPQKPLVDRAAELAALVKAAAESAVISSGDEIPAHVTRMRGLMGKVESDLARLDDDLGKVVPRLAQRPNPQDEEDGFWDWLFGADEEMPDDERQVKREKAWEKAAKLRENLQTLTNTVKENRSQLFARETLAQANQALCVPLTLPGQPPIQAELLVHPDGEDQRKAGSGRHPTRIQLAIQTHHLGSVGISLEALGERLSVGLQVMTPEMKALFEKLSGDLKEQLGNTGYQLDPIGVQVAAHEIMTSLLLPTKRTRWGTDAIEGIR
jgi:hypothetical protein